MKEHPLRYMVDPDSNPISDEELDIVDAHELFHPYSSLTEYIDSLDCFGDYILTASLVDRDEALRHMCCGVESFDIPLKDRTLYLGFDSGH